MQDWACARAPVRVCSCAETSAPEKACRPHRRLASCPTTRCRRPVTSKAGTPTLTSGGCSNWPRAPSLRTTPSEQRAPRSYRQPRADRGCDVNVDIVSPRAASGEPHVTEMRLPAEQND